MCEDAPCCGCCGQQNDEGADERFYPGEEETHYWPGDGSGEDDLADYNANEASDYANEGADDSWGGEDSHLDGMGEE